MRVAVVLAILAWLAANAASAGDIHDAAKIGDTAGIIAALEAGANANDSDGRAPPLYYAARRGYMEAAKLLIERGADVNAPSELGTALTAAATRARFKMIVFLLQNGADPNATYNGDTPLHIVIKNKCTDCVEELVDAGADVNRRTPDGKTALHLARLLGYADIDAYLMANGAVPLKPPPISARLAKAEIARGKELFISECGGCHTIAPEKSVKEGPHLWGVVGRERASLPDTNYSAVLQAWDGVWTFEDLNLFIYGPMAGVPGVKMNYPGIDNETDRADLIAYLRTQADSPVPLP